MIQIEATPHRYIAVKRKATDDPSIDLKRLKFVTSSNTLSKTDLKKLLVEKTPTLKDVNFEVEDYDEFVLKEKESSFPKREEGTFICIVNEID